jgi:putative membrane protein
MKTILKISALCLIVMTYYPDLSIAQDSKKLAKEKNAEKFDEAPTRESQALFAVNAADLALTDAAISKLAATNASSAEIKNFAKMLADEQEKNYVELKTLSDKMNTTIPAAMSERNQEKYNTLSKLKGHDFDHAYSAYLKQSYKENIALYQNEADKGSKADYKKWSAQKLPALKTQQAKAEKLHQPNHK